MEFTDMVNEMPKPPTFTDQELVTMIQGYFLDNAKFPTISEVKKWGCGDSRAQLALKTVKDGSNAQFVVDEYHRIKPKPEPQPQPQPIKPADIEVDYADFTGARWFYLLPGEFEKCPDWIKLRLKTL